MKRTWKHNVNRWFRRRGSLPSSARMPRTSLPAWRASSFARPRARRQDFMAGMARWIKAVSLGVLAVLAVWVCWQSWIGLGIFNN